MRSSTVGRFTGSLSAPSARGSAVVDIDQSVNHKGMPRCALILDPELPVRAQPCRSFQGWRYLAEKDAPLDAISFQDDADELPAEMVEELRELGLL